MGPRTEPCGTPEETVILSEFEPFSSTVWFLLSRKSLIQFRVFSLIPLKWSFRSNFVKGFAKIKEDKVCLFTELHVLASSSTSMMSCVSQDLFSRNPFCNSKRMFWSVKCVWRSQKPQHAQAPYRGDMSGKLVDNLLGQFYPPF